MKSFEKKLNCQGICTPSKWWWHNDITKGSPQRGCLVGIKAEIDMSLGVIYTGLVFAIILAFLLLLISCCEVYNKKVDNKIAA